MMQAVQQKQRKDNRHVADGRPKGWAIGAVLRDTREHLGYTLNDISEAINVRTLQLQAIENADFDSLPGMTYAIGFIRAYAKFLDLDAEDLVRHYKDEFGTTDTKPDLDAPVDATAGQVPGVMLAGGALVIALVVFIVWMVFASGDDTPPEIPEVPPELAIEGVAVPDVTSPVLGDTDGLPAALAGAELAMTVDDDPQEQSQDQSVLGQKKMLSQQPSLEDFGRERVKVHPSVPLRPPVKHVRQLSVVLMDRANASANSAAAYISEPSSGISASQKPGQPLSGVVTPQGTARINSRITLVANRTSWVEVYETGGKVLMTRVMKKGERYMVPNRKGVYLTSGNAGALDVFVDGKKVKPLGGLGDVMRGIELNPERLKRR